MTSLLEEITHADDEEVRMKIAKSVASLISIDWGSLFRGLYGCGLGRILLG